MSNDFDRVYLDVYEDLVVGRGMDTDEARVQAQDIALDIIAGRIEHGDY
jgi:hypothetical protein